MQRPSGFAEMAGGHHGGGMRPLVLPPGGFVNMAGLGMLGGVGLRPPMQPAGGFAGMARGPG